MTLVSPDIAIHPDHVEEKRRAREYRLATVDIPLLRAFAFTLVALGAWLHNHYILPDLPENAWLIATGVLAAQVVIAWGVVYAFLHARPPRNLSTLFLCLDLLAMTAVIYFCGAERSWGFFILLLRIADQTSTTFRRCLGFALFATLSYASMILWVIFVDGRGFDLGVALTKISFVLLGGLYIALTARTAEARRTQLTNAIRVSRDLIRRLEEAHARAEEASAAKSEFVTNMSHEMRTPLQGVIGMLQLAIDDEPAEETVRRLETARRSAETLMAMIDDVLDFSRIEARKLELEPVYFSLRELMTDTMKSVAALAASKKLTLSYYVHPDCPETVWGDPVRLRQVLFNLAGNAIKFTHEGEIAVHVSRAGGKIRFDVRDTGIGIAPAVRQRIFEPFTQEDSSLSRRYGGAGLGLSIVVRLLEAMGSTVDVSSQQGSGSVFSFTIPLPADAVGAAPEQPAWEAALAGRSILIVEPAEMARGTMAEILRARGVFASAFGRASDAPLGRFACAVTSDPSVRTQPQVLITSPLEHAGNTIHVTRPVGERELLDAIGLALGLSQRRPQYTLEPTLRAAATLRVLVVDDNEVNREVVAEMLRRLGHEATLADDGETALARLEQGGYDAVFMDVQLPGIDGLEVTRRVRAWSRTTPIIGLTAHASQQDRDRCIAAGMNAVLTKPVIAQQLEAALSASIRRDDTLAEIAGSNPALLARVRDAFSRQTPELLTGIREAIAANDPDALARHAHKLKGSLSYFNGRAHTIARDLEATAKRRDLVACAALLPDLERAITAVNEALGAS
ncbi:MAG TPA: ATP-binding protein [Thermoanaerobaculia bacterium]|nr:ATP-binding protein [Thermoanaerobaculia bacterium]